MPNEPLTGARYPAASASPNVPQDLQNAVTDLADNTIPRFATTTARDSAYASWVAAGGAMAAGLHCTVAGRLYRYTGSAWEDQQTGGRQRFWTFGRTGNASDTVASGSFIVMQSATITDAPAGDYAITARLVMSHSVGAPGFQRTTANGVSISPSDARADVPNTARVSFVQAGGVTHTGGNLTVAQYYSSTAANPTVWSQGTEIAVYYLGPR
jgi:hypothetical protein